MEKIFFHVEFFTTCSHSTPFGVVPNQKPIPGSHPGLFTFNHFAVIFAKLTTLGFESRLNTADDQLLMCLRP